MHFVVGKYPLPLCVEQQCAVIGGESRPPRGIFLLLPFDDAGDKGMPETNRETRSALGKPRILKRKRSRGFRPNEKIGLVSGGCEAESLDFVELAGMYPEPSGRVFGRFRKIELDGARIMTRLRFRHEPRASHHDQ